MEMLKLFFVFTEREEL